MSKIGTKLIDVPSGVEVSVLADHIAIKNSNGNLQVPLFSGMQVQQDSNKLSILCQSKELAAKHGLVRSLVFNCIVGLTKGFEKTLLLKGVGFKAVKKGDSLTLSIGFSHDIQYAIPKDVQVSVPEPTKIQIKGIDKQRVGQVAADIKRFKKMDPYKGKGIFLEGEVIKRKAGKSAKK